MSAGFRWNAWNLEHATKHGVTVPKIEAVVRRSARKYVGNGKYRVVGRGIGDRWIHVIYFFDPEGTIFVIHARPLTDQE